MRTHAKKFWMWFLWAIILLSLIGGGPWAYQYRKKTMRRRVEKNLSTVAQLKANAIAFWRKECLKDASILQKSVSVLQAVASFLADPSRDHARNLSKHLRILAKIQHYTDILLVDPTGKKVWSLTGVLHGDDAACLSGAIRRRKPAFIDLYIEKSNGAPRIGVVVPLSQDKEDQKPLGSLILFSDPSRTLYPLIQSWPTASKTAEAFLVRRNGDNALFLNPLRYLPDAALKRRIPLTRTESPAVKAVLSRQGIFEGRDYRGVAVLASVQPIADSPWLLVAKEDAATVFADWRIHSILLKSLFLGLAAILATLGMILWQREEKIHFRELYYSEAAFHADLERHRIVLNSIGDGVIATDAGSLVNLLNPVAEALTGWSKAAATGKPLEKVFRIVDEETGQKVENPVSKALAENTVVGASHTVLIARDGTKRLIANLGTPIRDEKNQIIGVVLVFGDRTEERLRLQITQARLTLVEYSATHSLDELMAKALDEIGKLVDSPIGFFHVVKPDQKTLSRQKWSNGTVKKYCRAEKNDRLHCSIEQAGVWAEAVRKRKPIVHNDLAALEHRKGFPEGHPNVIRQMVIPVIRNEKVVAVLGLGNKQVDYTDRDVEHAVFFAGVIWELGLQKIMEEAWRDSEKRHRVLFESARDGILLLDADSGRIIDVNPFLSHMIGLPKENLLGKFPWEIGPLENIAATKDAFDALKAHEHVRLDDLRLESVDGRVLTIEFDSTLFMVDDTRIMQYTMRDITERKQAEKELQESQNKYKAMFENVGLGVRLIGPDMRILEMNRQLCDQFPGVNMAEPICYRTFQIPPRESRCEDCPVAKTLRDGSNNEAIHTKKMAGGRMHTYRIVSSPVHDAEGKVIAAIEMVEDITEKVRLEAHFQQVQKMESVGQLAGGVAHDYNNILNVILGYAEIALKNVDPSEPLYDYLNQILVAAQRSSAVTKQLLAFARKQTIVPKVLDVNRIVESMLTMLRKLIGEQLDLAWRPAPELWRAKIDPSQLEQILVNLCVNARDAISEVGKITIESQNVSLDQDYCADNPGFVSGEFVTLSVSDDGSGMDKETMDRVFEPFFTTKEVGRGTGLGLASVFGIIEQNKGFINVSSEPGKGTTFRIYLPRHLGATETMNMKTISEIPMGCGELVLLAEDDTAIRQMSQEMLEKLGYQVLSAGTPGEALLIAEERGDDIHLLITDVVMPNMNGLDLSNQLHKLYPDIKTLFISGYTADVIAQKGVLDDGVQFIPKPFSMKDLGFKLRKILDEK